MRHPITLFVLIFCTAIACLAEKIPSAARQITLNNQGCQVRYTPVETATSLNAPVTLELDIACDGTPTAIDIDTSPFQEHFEVTMSSEQPVAGAGQYQKHYSLSFDPLAPGDLSMPELLISISPKDKPPVILSIPAATLHVAAPTEEELKTPLDDSAATTPLGATPPTDWTPLVILLCCLLAAAAIFAAIWFIRRRLARRPGPSKPRTPPHIAALAQLDALLAQKLVEQGEAQLFYNQISEILRDYIRGQFGIDAPDRTTEEFLEELRRQPDVFSKRHTVLLNNFLKHTDLVKYAGITPSQDEVRQTIEDTRSFIRETIPLEQP